MNSARHRTRMPSVSRSRHCHHHLPDSGDEMTTSHSPRVGLRYLFGSSQQLGRLRWSLSRAAAGERTWNCGFFSSFLTLLGTPASATSSVVHPPWPVPRRASLARRRRMSRGLWQSNGGSQAVGVQALSPVAFSLNPEAERLGQVTASGKQKVMAGSRT